MTPTETIKKAMLKTKTTQTQLAKLTNQSQKNLSAKMKRDNFKLAEFEKLLNALGCNVTITITLPNGEKL